MQDNIQLLMFLIKIHREEVQNHLTTVGSVFYWTITIILGITAAIFGASSGSSWIKTDFALERGVIVIAAITSNILICMLACREMIHAFRGFNENAKVVADISILLGFFERDKFAQSHDPIYHSD